MARAVAKAMADPGPPGESVLQRSALLQVKDVRTNLVLRHSICSETHWSAVIARFVNRRNWTAATVAGLCWSPSQILTCSAVCCGPGCRSYGSVGHNARKCTFFAAVRWKVHLEIVFNSDISLFPPAGACSECGGYRKVEFGSEPPEASQRAEEGKTRATQLLIFDRSSLEPFALWP